MTTVVYHPTVFSKIRIPTILGFGLLVTALFLGLAIYFYNLELNKHLIRNYQPQNIKIVNLTDHSAAITWQTSVETTGAIAYQQQYSTHFSMDDRDNNVPRNRLTHFITLKELLPDTTYNFKVKSSSVTYANKGFVFKTAKLPGNEDNKILVKPIIGRILEPNLEPVKEALVYLDLPGATPLGTFTSVEGNFVLPLSDVRKADLSSVFNLTQDSLASLHITRGEVLSDASIKVPSQVNAYPPLILGQAADFTSIRTDFLTNSNKFDLNKDGKVNAVDLSIVILNMGKKGENPADLNQDKIVDKKDLELVQKSLKGSS